jgi:eukaryotic-like serine/threonine-protein kinase
MTEPARYSQIKEVFIEVVDLPIEQREAAIRERCRGDDAMVEEVLALLDYESEETLSRRRERLKAKHSTAKAFLTAVDGAVQRKLLPSIIKLFDELWFRWFAWAVLIQFLLLGLSYLGWRSTDAYAVRLVQDNLTTTLKSQSNAITLWLDSRVEEAEGFANNPELIKAVVRLNQLAEQTPGDPTAEPFLELPETEDIKSILGRYAPAQAPLPQSIKNDWTFGISNELGLIVAASNNSDVAKRLTAAGRSASARVFDGEKILIPPKPTGGFVPGYVTDMDDPRIWILVPIHEIGSKKVISCLGLVLRVDREFSRIIESGRGPFFIDTYLFDESGRAVSDVKHEQDVKHIGLVPNSPDARSGLRLILRDPGENLLGKHEVPSDIETKPLTALVRSAIASKEVCNMNGYRDYRGVLVVGASHWIGRYGIGIIAEVDRADVDKASVAWRWLCYAQMLGLGLTFSGLGVSKLQRLTGGRIGRLTKIGDYPIIRRIGDGGMGIVYLCAHPRLKRRCAVKVLRADKDNPETRARMEREAQLASSLNHAHTVQIYDMGVTANGLPFLVMEFVQGETIYDATQHRPMAPDRALRIWKQVIEAVAEAHERRILHRDIKPQNIMLCKRGNDPDFAKLLDFGLVKDMESRLDDLTTVSVGWLGTPRYMAPERMGNPKLVDVRSDIYGLGVVAYRMLTGQDPYATKIGEALVESGFSQSLVLPSQVGGQDIAPELEQLVVQCLSRNPEERPANCQEVLNKLERITKPAKEKTS